MLAAMRVLVTSTPGVGHIFPLVPMAVALRDAGHDVTWALAPGAGDPVERLGFRCLPVGADRATAEARDRERDPELFRRFATTPPRERRRLLLPRFVDGAARLIGDLSALIDGLRPDVVVHEPNAYAAPPAACARGIPHVTVGFGGLLPDALLESGADAIAALWASVGLEPPDHAGLYDDVYLHPFPPSLGAVPGDRNVEPMRPLGYDGADDEAAAPDWLGSVGAERPLVYVTFGTEIAAFAPTTDVVEAVGRLDVDAVLTVGPRREPDSIGDRPDNLRVQRYVPQRAVLARAALLIAHAGSGAVLGAAARGIPQLCLPVAADQFENADAVAASGAGLMLEPHEVTAEAVVDAATALLTEPTFATAASRVADEIAAMPHPAELVGRVEAVVAAVG
jgi:UDP:flavonoid glycosyltransferase YjiC (YdhE family)